MHAPTLRRRRPRAAVAGLALALLATLTACDAADINDVLNDEADAASSTEMNGGEAAGSIDLADGRYLQLFNNAHVGTINGSGNRVSNTLVANAMATMHSSTGVVAQYIGASTTARFVPSGGTTTYRLGDGIKDGSTVHVLMSERQPGTDVVLGNAIVTLSLPNLTQTGSIVTLAAGSSPTAWGTTLFDRNGYTYIYGSQLDGSTTRTVLARVATGSLRTTASWRYWTGTNWSTNQDAAVPLVDTEGDPLDFLVAPMNTGGQILGVGSQPRSSSAFQWANAYNPLTAYTNSGTAIFAPEDGDACGSGGELVVFGAQPHMYQSGETIPGPVYSYSVECRATSPNTPGSRSADHRPRYVNLDHLEAPNPCPITTSTWTEEVARAAYLDLLLNATPTTGEIDYWSGSMDSTGFCATTLFDQLTLDDNFSGNTINDLYQQLLGRVAGPSEQTYWRPGVEDRSTTVADLAQNIVASPEFFTLSGSTNGGYVDRLYDTILDRTPTTTERNYWIAQITGGATRGTVGRTIYQSEESRVIRVDDLSDRYLQTGLEPFETKPRWVATLGYNGGDDIGVAVAFTKLPLYWDNAADRF